MFLRYARKAISLKTNNKNLKTSNTGNTSTITGNINTNSFGKEVQIVTVTLDPHLTPPSQSLDPSLQSLSMSLQQQVKVWMLTPENLDQVRSEHSYPHVPRHQLAKVSIVYL